MSCTDVEWCPGCKDWRPTGHEHVYQASAETRRWLGRLLGEGREFFVPEERALKKQESRDRDDRALASGEKTREQLTKESAFFSFGKYKIVSYGGPPPEVIDCRCCSEEGDNSEDCFCVEGCPNS